MCYYPGKSSLLWPLFHVFLGNLFISLSMLTLCLKDPQKGKDTVHPEILLTVGVVCWCKLHGFWQLIYENSPLMINNHLLERIVVTVIYPIYLKRLPLYHSDMAFIFKQISKQKKERERERERERELERVYKNRHKETPRITALEDSVHLNSTNNRFPNDYSLNWLQQNYYFLNVYVSKIRISFVLYHTTLYTTYGRYL